MSLQVGDFVKLPTNKNGVFHHYTLGKITYVSDKGYHFYVGLNHTGFAMFEWVAENQVIPTDEEVMLWKLRN